MIKARRNCLVKMTKKETQTYGWTQFLNLSFCFSKDHRRSLHFKPWVSTDNCRGAGAQGSTPRSYHPSATRCFDLAMQTMLIVQPSLLVCYEKPGRRKDKKRKEIYTQSRKGRKELNHKRKKNLFINFKSSERHPIRRLCNKDSFWVTAHFKFQIVNSYSFLNLQSTYFLYIVQWSSLKLKKN